MSISRMTVILLISALLPELGSLDLSTSSRDTSSISHTYKISPSYYCLFISNEWSNKSLYILEKIELQTSSCTDLNKDERARESISLENSRNNIIAIRLKRFSLLTLPINFSTSQSPSKKTILNQTKPEIIRFLIDRFYANWSRHDSFSAVSFQYHS